MGKYSFSQTRLILYGRWWDSNSRPKSRVLPSSLFAKASVQYAAGELGIIRFDVGKFNFLKNGCLFMDSGEIRTCDPKVMFYRRLQIARHESVGLLAKGGPTAHPNRALEQTKVPSYLVSSWPPWTKRVAYPQSFCLGPRTGVSGENLSLPTTDLDKNQEYGQEFP